MDPDYLLVAVLGGMFGLALAAPLITRAMGRAAGYPLGAGYALAGALLVLRAPAVLRGEEVVAAFSWAPSLGVGFTLVLDGLSLLFSLLVLVIGALVMAYSAAYLKREGAHGGFYSVLTLFAAAMLGLVLAGDAILLFVFWELTSISSFFLIGGDGRAGGKPATRAFLVTGLGGLALFAGLLLTGIAAGSFDLREIMTDPGAVREHAFAPAILALLLAGAFTKSAQVPFHFWLPGAMVAPTPVSTYLHAATMVKAGIYLLARVSPLFGGTAPWLYVVVFTGLVTAVVGAGLALRQHDLKALLAYSTVSQLGFITALVGVGTVPALAAAAAHTIAHAAYKATLFMVVGIIDHEAGSRDIRELSGLRRMMPLTATVTGVAALSMAGFPPLLGFVSKEEALGAFLAAPGGRGFGVAAAVLAVTASVMTLAYGARIFDGAFGGPPRQRLYDPALRFLAPAAVTALAGVALGFGISGLDPLVGALARDALGSSGTVHLALWHGLTPALGLSALTIAGGFTLFLARDRVDRTFGTLRGPLDGAVFFDRGHEATVAAGRLVGRPFVSDVPARHLGWIFGAVAVAGLAAWAGHGEVLPLPAPRGLPPEWAVAVLLALAVLAAAAARTRITAVAVLGIAGFLVAVLYVLLGAPDLALTQLLVETLTVALVVLVFRRLPQSFREVSRRRRSAAGGAALGMGVLAGLAAYRLTGRRGISQVGEYYLGAAVPEAGGRNVVNTILVDFRALDTLGEITVLAVAAIGVVSLARLVAGAGR